MSNQAADALRTLAAREDDAAEESGYRAALAREQAERHAARAHEHTTLAANYREAADKLEGATE